MSESRSVTATGQPSASSWRISAMNLAVMARASGSAWDRFSITTRYGTSIRFMSPVAILSARASRFLPCQSGAPTAWKNES